MVRKGEYTPALALIDAGFATASKEAQREMLRLKGNALFDQRDIPGALAAYQAYLDTGVHGTNAIEVAKIIRNLQQASTVEISVSNGPADIYLDGKAHGPFCAATAACTKQVMPGPHRVTVERAGFEAKTEHVTLQGAKPAQVAVTLVEQPSQLTVHVAQPGAQVTVDGTAYAGPVDVPAGDHRIVVTLDRYVEAHVDSAAHEGKPVSVEVDLVPVPPPPAPPPPPRVVVEQPSHWFTTRRKLAVAAGGVAVAGFALGAVFGVQARNADHDAGALCPSPATPCRDAAQADALNQHGRDRATLANVAFGVASAGAIAATVLWMVGAPESHVAVAPHVGPNVAALDLSLRF